MYHSVKQIVLALGLLTACSSVPYGAASTTGYTDYLQALRQPPSMNDFIVKNYDGSVTFDKVKYRSALASYESYLNAYITYLADGNKDNSLAKNCNLRYGFKPVSLPPIPDVEGLSVTARDNILATHIVTIRRSVSIHNQFYEDCF